ncbi:MAG: nucleotide exchange factor GrpE [Candidatus Parcubacteria bacterium]|nr:nucleotide exchange factor GrpE [Candidatus Parcubacteria bacterium]
MIKKNTNQLQKNDSPPSKDLIVIESDSVEELRKQIEKLEKERDDYLKSWQQERADVLNYKRREEERVGGVIKFANQSLLRELINVLDNFDFTFSNLESIEKNEEDKPKNWETMLKGIYLIRSNLERVVKEYGLVKIDSLGKTFDPTLHEAINYTSDSSRPVDIITEELQSGYSLNGRTIRSAKVIVNSPQEDKPQSK